MPTRPTWAGPHEFDRRSKTRVLHPPDKIVTATAPPLIDHEMLAAVLAQLKARNPKIAPARVVGGPTMLTGICFCAGCGGA